MSESRGTRLHLAPVSNGDEIVPARGETKPETMPAHTENRPRALRFSSGPASLRRRHWAIAVISILWLSALGGYVWGYFGPSLFAPQSITLWAGIAAAALVPIVLVVMLVELTTQARGLARATFAISRLAERMMEPEDQAAARVATVGGAIRKQLDLLSSALDSTLDRVAAIETMVETQVGAVERVGGRAQMRAQMIRDLLQDERNALNAIAESLNASAGAIVEAVSARVAEARETNERAMRDLKSVEATLTSGADGLLRAAAETTQKVAEQYQLVQSASEKLEDAGAQSLINARNLTAQLTEQQGQLQAAVDRLDAEGARLHTLFTNESELVARVEAAGEGLSERLAPVLRGVAGDFDAAMANVEARAAEAGRSVRAEAESAQRVNSEAAQALAAAAATGRKTAEEMRISIIADLSALGQSLEERAKALDAAMAGVNRAMAGAGQNAGALSGSFESAMRVLDTASNRLVELAQRISAETTTARDAMDSAADAMERKFAHVPELAAEQAARLSSLLGDQASRIGALAQSLSTTSLATPKTPESELHAPAPPALSTPPALPAPSEAPQAPVREPSALPTTYPPSGSPPDRQAESAASPIAPRTGASALPPAELNDFDDEESSPGLLSRFGRLLGRQRRDEELPRDTGAEGDINHGFWTSLFARIEGNEHSVIELPPESLLHSGDTGPEDAGLNGNKVRHALEGLHAIAIDLDRLLEETPPVELWNRYRAGEHDVFARRLVGQRGEALDARIRQRYQDDAEFRTHADRYVVRYGELVAYVDDDHDRASIQSTAAGRLNTLLTRALTAKR